MNSFNAFRDLHIELDRLAEVLFALVSSIADGYIQEEDGIDGIIECRLEMREVLNKMLVIAERLSEDGNIWSHLVVSIKRGLASVENKLGVETNET